MAIFSRVAAAPWSTEDSHNEKGGTVSVTEISEPTSREVEWYHPVMKTLPSTTVEVFVKYSGVAEEEVRQHIYSVRDKAWEV